MTEPTGWNHMLPCPFCGGDARHDAHADDCYFILHSKLKNSSADMSPAFEVLAAWNRRAPQPTQAQAGAVPLTPFIPAQRERLFYNRPENVGKGSTMADWHRVVQYIEAAHGIGIKKGDSHG